MLITVRDDWLVTTFHDSVQYLSEKFTAGASSLAHGAGPIKERLLNAYRSQVIRGDKPGAELPEELATRINALHSRMLAGTETGQDGSIALTVERMTESEAEDIASEIFDIHVELLRADETSLHQ